MGMPSSHLQRAGAVALPLVAVLFLWLRCAYSPQVMFISQDPRAPWIVAPSEVTAVAQIAGPAGSVATEFSRSFDAASAPGPVQLHVRALRELALTLNGKAVPGLAFDAERWKEEATVDVTALLVPGTNTLRATVRNPRGPALLALRVEGLSAPLRTDPSWSAQATGEPAVPAQLADDTRPFPGRGAGPLAGRSVAGRGLLLLGLFAFAATTSALWRRRAGPRLGAALPRLALLAALTLFAASVLATYARIPVRAGFGFDLGNHLAYVEFVRREHALPLATDGWATYHPPLFYALSALLAAGFAAWLPGVDAWSALRVLPFLSGLVLVGVAWGLARALAPGDTRTSVLAALFAAATPVNLYMAAYPSNEAPHAALLALAMLAIVRALLAERASTALLAGAGLLFGLALLTKFTALLVIPVAIFFLVCKLWLLERASLSRIAAQLLIFALPLLAVCGWWYARNVIYFGRPIVSNWGRPGDALVWWQQPGFHTAAYYTHFGSALARPLFSGFESFWDALYSTFWADGFVGGRAGVLLRNAAFDYELMAAVALLALPACLFVAIGGGRTLARALGDPDAHRRAAYSFLLTAVFVVGFSMLYVTLELPYAGQARAPYGLALVPPLSLFFGIGLARRAGTRWPGGELTESLLAGWLGALFGASWLALWA
jgi:hypothetical protein